ncbi:hypothetical protein GCM10027295_12450 [Pseudaeromonas pectinilytica]|jgi:hypothetical protein
MTGYGVITCHELKSNQHGLAQFEPHRHQCFAGPCDPGWGYEFPFLNCRDGGFVEHGKTGTFME